MSPLEIAEHVDQLTDEQFLENARQVLEREFGVYGLARFIRLYRPGSGDYTEDRHRWLDALTIDEFLSTPVSPIPSASPGQPSTVAPPSRNR